MARKGKQIRYCEPVMLLRMVRLVAQITSPTTHLVIARHLAVSPRTSAALLGQISKWWSWRRQYAQVCNDPTWIALTISFGGLESARLSSFCATHSAHSCQVTGLRGGPASKTHPLLSNTERKSGTNFCK